MGGPFLVSSSVRDNIAYGLPNADLDDVVRAATAAQAHEFITELGNGYDTVFGERGYTLSGGQRQRAWLAMVLAQDAAVGLLDEPTTYLDISHQVELLDLLRELAADGKTVITGLHDVNQACRYADHLAVMQGGRLVADGVPGAVMDAGLMRRVFDVQVQILREPVAGTPMCVVERSTRLTSTG